MAKKQKPPEFPEESRICGVIFLMQMVAILSAVSIVYLTVSAPTRQPKPDGFPDWWVTTPSGVVLG